MKKLSIFILASQLAAAASAQIMVVSKTPSGPVKDMNAARRVAATFSRPISALTSAEQMGSSCPLEVMEISGVLTEENYPGYSSARLEDFKELKPVQGRCRWQGTQTVAFEPAEPLAPATLYAARIKAGVKSASGELLEEDTVWFFETVRPAIMESAPYNDQRWLPLDTIVYAAFNLPVDHARARGFIKLEETAPDGTVKEIHAGVRRAKDKE
ncbi:MAG: hypothetical protein COT18_08160, partial [Elusimicrobia bacterium CG08_land_8_20_14_0_20_59_10]